MLWANAKTHKTFSRNSPAREIPCCFICCTAKRKRSIKKSIILDTHSYFFKKLLLEDRIIPKGKYIKNKNIFELNILMSDNE